MVVGVTDLQTHPWERGCKLLILLGGSCDVHSTRVFWEKRLYLPDSKGFDFFGEDKEAAAA